MSQFIYSDDRDGRRWKVDWPAFRTETPDCLEEEIARLISIRKVVGVFWGRSEFGPRALGNRSIFADPRWEGMKDYINERVKHRQWFRPYAPLVLEEKASEWFHMEAPSPHMLIVAAAREDKRDLMPAVTHIDGTARVQTISPKDDCPARRVVEAFDRLTGVPIVINTSFNDHGEAIVETPLDAFQCFARTGMDVLVLGRRILIKEGA